MDLSFGRGGVDLGAGTVRLDYPQLVAILSSAQAASRTARVARSIAAGGENASGTAGALVALFDAQPGRAVSVEVLAGSFNPAAAGKSP